MLHELLSPALYNEPWILGQKNKQIGKLQIENDFLKKKVQTIVRDRTAAIEPDHPALSIREQCRILGITRSRYYYKAVEKEEDRDLAIVNAILEELKTHPFYGYRKIARALADIGVTRKQARRIMHKAGLRAIYPKKRTSIPAKEHKKYPYLLKNTEVWLPNQVWVTDITYIKLGKGFVYLVMILDLYSRKILSWKL